MSQINPFTGSVLQAPHVQRAQAADKDRQLRRVHDLSKNAALQGEQLQHEVESSEALSPVQDDQQRKPPRRRNPPREPDPNAQEESTGDGTSHIDLTA